MVQYSHLDGKPNAEVYIHHDIAVSVLYILHNFSSKCFTVGELLVDSFRRTSSVDNK